MLEAVFTLLILIALGMACFEFYYFKKRQEELANEIKRLRAVINKISFDITIEKILETTEGLGRKKLTELGERIFEFLKKRYSLENVTTYMEMKKRIEEMDSIPEEEKEDVLEFLENMIYLEYSSKPLTGRRKEKMKELLMKMLRTMGESQKA